MPRLGTPEILLILLLVLLLFGSSRMPDAARGLGRSLRIFKAETRGLIADDQPAAAAVTSVPPVPAVPVSPPADPGVAAQQSAAAQQPRE
ncbi:MAG: Sec-independent protein translocase subunit TatA [Candidatus Nanopelagicales bacterium]